MSELDRSDKPSRVEVSTQINVIVPIDMAREMVEAGEEVEIVSGGKSRRRRMREKQVIMSPLLRYILATAKPRPDGRPNLLPLQIPECCCHRVFTCGEPVQWRVGDGKNFVWFCQRDLEEFWEAGYCVQDFTVERWRL